MADLRALFATPGANLGGRYRVERELGCGKRAMVLGATLLDNQSSRRALRFWLADGERAAAGTSRFWQRAQAIDLFRDPHVVEVFDVGEVEGVSYVATEWLAGRSLTRVLERSGTLSWSLARELLWPCFRAVSAAHSGGVVHGQFAPANIFVCGVDPRGPRTARITGWEWGSVASAAEPDDGTQLYLAPEVRHGYQATPRSDVYGLAAVLYRALQGQAPCATGESARQDKSFRAQRTLQYAAAPTVPRSVMSAIERALDEDPRERQASVSELIEDLQHERQARGWSAGLPDAPPARWVKRVADAEGELSLRARYERPVRHARAGLLPAGSLARAACAAAATAALGYSAYLLLFGPDKAVRELDAPLTAATDTAESSGPITSPKLSASSNTLRQSERLPPQKAQARDLELSPLERAPETEPSLPPPRAASPVARPAAQVERATPRLAPPPLPAAAPAAPAPEPKTGSQTAQPVQGANGQMRLL